MITDTDNIGNQAQQLPPIHFSAYQLCVFTRHRKVEIAYTAISLLYGSLFSEVFHLSSFINITTDTLAFLVIVVLAVRAGLNGAKVPRILRSIVQDTTLYFLVIFTSHFVLVMTLLFARVSLSIICDMSDAETSLANHPTPAG